MMPSQSHAGAPPTPDPDLLLPASVAWGYSGYSNPALHTRALPPQLGLVRSFSSGWFPSVPKASLSPQLTLCRALSSSNQNQGPALDLAQGPRNRPPDSSSETLRPPPSPAQQPSQPQVALPE